MIKTIKEKIVYLEEVKHIKLEVNGKKIEIEKYAKQDEEFGYYDNDWSIIKGKNLLTEEEEDEVHDFVYD